MLDEKNIGGLGERLAENYLRKKGYKIMARNFKKRYGELDLVCLHHDGRAEVLVFVEVKTRGPGELMPAEEAVTLQKIGQLKKTGEYFLQRYAGKLPELMRIDVVAVELDFEAKLKKLRHIKDVTM